MIQIVKRVITPKLYLNSPGLAGMEIAVSADIGAHDMVGVQFLPLRTPRAGGSRERVIAGARDTRQALPFVQPVDVTADSFALAVGRGVKSTEALCAHLNVLPTQSCRAASKITRRTALIAGSADSGEFATGNAPTFAAREP